MNYESHGLGSILDDIYGLYVSLDESITQDAKEISDQSKAENKAQTDILNAKIAQVKTTTELGNKVIYSEQEKEKIKEYIITATAISGVALLTLFILKRSKK